MTLIAHGVRDGVKVKNMDFGLKLLVYFHSDSFLSDLKERIYFWRAERGVREMRNVLSEGTGDEEMLRLYGKRGVTLERSENEVRMMGRLNGYLFHRLLIKLSTRGNKTTDNQRDSYARKLLGGEEGWSKGQWKHFRADSKRWHDIAERCGLGILLMLPTDSDKFAESRFMKLRHEELGWMWKVLGKGAPKLRETAGKLSELTAHLAEYWTLAGAGEIQLEKANRTATLEEELWMGLMERQTIGLEEIQASCDQDEAQEEIHPGRDRGEGATVGRNDELHFVPSDKVAFELSDGLTVGTCDVGDLESESGDFETVQSREAESRRHGWKRKSTVQRGRLGMVGMKVVRLEGHV